MTEPLSRRQFVAGAAATALALRTPSLRSQSAAAPRVTTADGTLRGEALGSVRVFRGVPFAAPPVGPLRFRPPVPAAAWPGERDATQFAPAAMQADRAASAISEDCLYLNVWTPHDARNLPVYVWIHGGGYTGGDSFSPELNGMHFATEGIIVVTIAYRLGVFGFLDVEPLLGPGYAGSANNAVRDVMQALHWVQRNIAAFGGDPRRVTLGGQSAGAKMTDILLGVPEAEGLFHQAITESGGAERVWPLSNARTVAQGFASTWAHGAAALKTAPAADLIEAQVEFLRTWPQHFPLRPEVDGHLVPRLPVLTIAQGNGRGKRLLIGTNRDESASFLGPQPSHDPTAADLGNLSLAQFNAVFAHYRALYPGLSPEQLRIRATTAEEYWVPSVRAASAAVRGGAQVWMYLLTFPDPYGHDKGYAHHSEELPMAWGDPQPPDPVERSLAASIHDAWVAFIRGAAPAAPGLPEWPAYTPADRKTMVLDATSHVVSAPQQAELDLWNGVL